jgi:hypothetical protein
MQYNGSIRRHACYQIQFKLNMIASLLLFMGALEAICIRILLHAYTHMDACPAHGRQQISYDEAYLSKRNCRIPSSAAPNLPGVWV